MSLIKLIFDSCQLVRECPTASNSSRQLRLAFSIKKNSLSDIILTRHTHIYIKTGVYICFEFKPGRLHDKCVLNLTCLCTKKIRLTAQLRPSQATSIHGGLTGHILPEVSELLPVSARLTDTVRPGDTPASDYKHFMY